MIIIPCTDIDGAARQREVIARMRAVESGLAVPGPAPGPDQRPQYLEDHKAEIIADYKQLGRKLTRERWKLTETEWDGLTRGRWAEDVKPVIAANKKKRKPRVEPSCRTRDLRRLKGKFCPMLKAAAQECSLLL